MAVEKEQSGSSLSGGIMIANKCHRCQTRFFLNQLYHLHCHCLKMAPGGLKLVSENIISSQLSLPLRVCLISKLVLMTRPVKWQCLILITRYKEIFIISIIQQIKQVSYVCFCQHSNLSLLYANSITEHRFTFNIK